MSLPSSAVTNESSGSVGRTALLVSTSTNSPPAGTKATAIDGTTVIGDLVPPLEIPTPERTETQTPVTKDRHHPALGLPASMAGRPSLYLTTAMELPSNTTSTPRGRRLCGGEEWRRRRERQMHRSGALSSLSTKRPGERTLPPEGRDDPLAVCDRATPEAPMSLPLGASDHTSSPRRQGASPESHTL